MAISDEELPGKQEGQNQRQRPKCRNTTGQPACRISSGKGFTKAEHPQKDDLTAPGGLNQGRFPVRKVAKWLGLWQLTLRGDPGSVFQVSPDIGVPERCQAVEEGNHSEQEDGRDLSRAKGEKTG